MADFRDIPAASAWGRTIPLTEVLYRAKVADRFSWFREAIYEHLIEQAAAREGITVDDAELQARADQFRGQYGLARAAETRQWLERNSLTVDDFEFRVRTALIKEKLRDQMFDDAQVEEFFRQDPGGFAAAELSQIVVADEGLAQQLADGIRSGRQVFEDEARTHSLDAGSKLEGGHVGWINRDDLHPDLAETALAAEPGAVLGPFRIGPAFHVIKVHEIWRPELSDRLRLAVRVVLFNRWLEEEAVRAGLEIRLPALSAGG